MAHPKVSVIMPLYNKALYLKKGVESVLAQSFKDWELLIVDDGSTDGSGQIADDLLKDMVNCRVIHQQNAGVSAARNRGIAESQGNYLAFLDADDWWAPTFLEEMTKLTEEYPDAGIYASNYIYWKPGKTRVGVRPEAIRLLGDKVMVGDDGRENGEMAKWQNGEFISGYINYPKSYYENGEQVVWTGAVLLDKRKLYGEMEKWLNGRNGEVFNTQVKLGEDFLLWLRLSLSYPVAFFNKPLAYYNNEQSGSLRLTGKLHKPEANMLWYMDNILDSYLKSVGVDVDVVVNKEDWKKLFDRLRVYGLRNYWLSKEYHTLAENELKKVDWNAIKDEPWAIAGKQWYDTPIWQLKLQQKIMTLSSWCKNQIIKIAK